MKLSSTRGKIGNCLGFYALYLLHCAQLCVAAPLTAGQADVLQATSTSSQVSSSSTAYYEYGTAIPQPPDCTIWNFNDCLGSDIVDSCYYNGFTSIFDLHCICFSSTLTPCNSCSQDYNRQLFLNWVVAVCSSLPGWSNDLSSNLALPSSDLLHVADFEGTGDLFSSTHIQYTPGNPFTATDPPNTWDGEVYYYIIDYPEALRACDWFTIQWNSSLVNGMVVEGLVKAGSPSLQSLGGAVPRSGELYIDRTSFCLSISFSDIQSNCNITYYYVPRQDVDLDILMFLNTTCGNMTGFNGLPDNWTDSLITLGTKYSNSSNFTWPGCLDAGNNTDCQLGTIRDNCETDFSTCDATVNCTDSELVVMGCFCSTIKYGETCKDNCGLSWERKEYLEWLNNTCSAQKNDTSLLPENWIDLLVVQPSELLPWHWNVVPETPTGSRIPEPCPPTSHKLLAFAGVNIAIALLTPIIGRRTVVKKLTFGIFGKQESRSWYLTGPFAVVLHLASNGINAQIIKNTPGFSHISVTNLTFLWCTRPRLAWLVVAFLPYQAEKAMYFSAAASTLFCEVILQLLGAYYMGLATNYARRQKFFLSGYLDGVALRREAQTMYRGSLLWLVVVAFAILACGWSIFGVSERIRYLRVYFKETRAVARQNLKSSNRQVGHLSSLHRRPNISKLSARQGQVKAFHEEMVSDIQVLTDWWKELALLWKELPSLVRQEESRRKKILNRAKNARKRLENTEVNSEKWLRQRNIVQSIEEELQKFKQAWSNSPSAHEQEGRILQQSIQDRHSLNQNYYGEVQRAAQACQERIAQQEQEIQSAQHALVRYEGNIAYWKTQVSRARNSVERQQREADYGALLVEKPELDERLERAMNRYNLKEEKKRNRDLTTLCETWRSLIESGEAAIQNVEAYVAHWERVGKQRKEEEEVKPPQIRHFPFVVVAGMLLCWIAQWLWWAGFVGVAGDQYCPPKLPLIATVWTLFAAFGTLFGTSF